MPVEPFCRNSMTEPEAAPFWKTKSLTEMSLEEWESLCDGCGRCCLLKLEDEDTGTILFTDVACRLFDARTCRCRSYANRSEKVADCVRLTPDNIHEIKWMPPSCAYRRLTEGKDLPRWHPLVCGDPEEVVRSGASVLGRVHALEDDLSLIDLVARIRAWPNHMPRRRRGTGR
jgi:uncharacterized cysteine cluster protein YcgN (CxxCxxCC family)